MKRVSKYPKTTFVWLFTSFDVFNKDNEFQKEKNLVAAIAEGKAVSSLLTFFQFNLGKLLMRHSRGLALSIVTLCQNFKGVIDSNKNTIFPAKLTIYTVRPNTL